MALEKINQHPSSIYRTGRFGIAYCYPLSIFNFYMGWIWGFPTPRSLPIPMTTPASPAIKGICTWMLPLQWVFILQTSDKQYATTMMTIAILFYSASTCFSNVWLWASTLVVLLTYDPQSSERCWPVPTDHWNCPVNLMSYGASLCTKSWHSDKWLVIYLLNVLVLYFQF